MFPIHRLLLIVFLSIFAAPAFAQGNPTVDPTCRLPKQGVIVASVTYTLKANCTQTGTLEIKTANTPNITVTINGEGFTISNGAGAEFPNRMNFLVVNDQGKDTFFETDTTTSSNVRVVINDVTLDGQDKRPRRPCKNWKNLDICQGMDTGSGIYVEGTLVMEDVTFTNGRDIWVRPMGTATLTNVLFENSLNDTHWGFGLLIKGILHVSKTSRVIVNNAVFRDSARTIIAVDKGGVLTTTGCLSFIRTFAYNVQHSGIVRDKGTWTDRSTGPCPSRTIGNGGQAVTAYNPTELPCGLPDDAVIGENMIYSLTQDCVCVRKFVVAAGVSVTINGNGFRIVGCDGNVFSFAGWSRVAGIYVGGKASLTINNANIYRIQMRNYGGAITVGHSMIAEAPTTALYNYGDVHVYKSTFQENQGANAYYGTDNFYMGRALFRDNMFRNNSVSQATLRANDPGTSITLCGENVREETEADDDTEMPPFFLATNGGRILGCPQPDQPKPVSAALNCVTEHTDLPENKLLGAIGVIIYKQKCPAVIEIWEVLPNSQGQFALTASQNDVEAVAQGVVACSSNGRAAVRVGLPEPVRQQMAHSKKYQAVSPRKARDILISMGPNAEGKVNHMVIDNALDGSVLGIVSTFSDEEPCQRASLSDVLAVAAPPPQPTAIPFAASVAPQPAREDGSIIHVVQSGDTIWQIGIAYDVHPFKIISLNQLDQLRNRGRYIFPGQELLIRAAE